MLQSGVGFSTNPKDAPNGALTLSGFGPSVFPVTPAGAAGSGTRQVVNVVSGGPGPGAGGGPVFINGGGPPTAGTQVYSVTSTITSDGHAMPDAPGTTTTTRIITAPPPEPPPPAPAPKP